MTEGSTYFPFAVWELLGQGSEAGQLQALNKSAAQRASWVFTEEGRFRGWGMSAALSNPFLQYLRPIWLSWPPRPHLWSGRKPADVCVSLASGLFDSTESSLESTPGWGARSENSEMTRLLFLLAGRKAGKAWWGPRPITEGHLLHW